MAIFSTVQKRKLSWVAPSVSSLARYLLVGSVFRLNIGNGFNLLISPDRSATEWSKTTRHGAGYTNNYTPANNVRPDTVWSKISKS